jgi:hypothetical protein
MYRTLNTKKPVQIRMGPPISNRSEDKQQSHFLVTEEIAGAAPVGSANFKQKEIQYNI